MTPIRMARIRPQARISRAIDGLPWCPTAPAVPGNADGAAAVGLDHHQVPAIEVALASIVRHHPTKIVRSCVVRASFPRGDAPDALCPNGGLVAEHYKKGY
jgi:hypothetical protein